MQSVFYDIQKRIEENPNATAVIYDESIFTFKDLEIQSNRLAHYLSDHHVEKGDKVVFLMRRSFDMLATILAIWKLGATYVPLDPRTPIERANNVITQLNPRCIITEPALLNKINQKKTPVLTLKDPIFSNYSPIFNVKPYENFEESLAYLIYTSGSTGEPKGVMLTHANIYNHVKWLVEKFHFSSQDCFSFNSSMAFDFSIACTLIPLSVGARIVITSEEDTLDIGRYCNQLEKNQVTFAKWTPSYFKLLVDYVEKYRPNLSAFRFIMLGGEELLTIYVKRWLTIYPNHSIINEYGPTEAAVGITTQVVTRSTLDETLHAVPIGKTAINTNLYIVNSKNVLAKKNEIGELLIGGASVGCGYYNQPELTAQRFIDNPFSSEKQILYRTGDLVKQLNDGSYFYVGRIDNQVKINGYRVELGEVERHILKYPGLKQTVVSVEQNQKSLNVLIAYIVINENQSINVEELQTYLLRYLPEFMVPKKYYFVNHIPLNKNGKVDHSALNKYATKTDIKEEEDSVFLPNSLLNLVINVIKKYINMNEVNINASFFSLGINSLLAVKIVDTINQKCGNVLNIQDLFLYSTIKSLVNFLEEKQKNNHKDHIDFSANYTNSKKHHDNEPIAIVAMDCRLPGANSCEALWDLCRNGKESISFFNAEASKKMLDISENTYPVYARGILDDIEYFDADFFNFSPKEAHLSDPQHRLLLESAWTVLEKAGYSPDFGESNKMGVFVSMNDSTYLIDHNLGRLGKNYFNDRFALTRLMSSQFLATKISYHLNCMGPSFTIQTACSSSLVSIALACQQLSSYQCDMALAGGISLITEQESPYFYQTGNIFSPDGHCRPFDANAQGTVFSNGLGLVILKRLSDALKNNDTIISVIKGVNINNDGHQKMSYTAPSIKGQMDCILSAQESANVEVDSIQYVEAHGTGTLIGDPIEVEALTKAFRTKTSREQYCALGSIKANMGHTHVAAGVAGLIKTALSLQNQQIPPLLNFQQPNPNIAFEHSPFYVNTRLQDWPRGQFPRRASLSAFGVGGTNAHLILEEAPEPKKNVKKRTFYSLFLSAKTPKALSDYHDNLINFFEKIDSKASHESLLADTAYTLQIGRKEFRCRSGIVCKDVNDALEKLKKVRDRNVKPISNDFLDSHRIIFLFPGQGTQYLNLSKLLYKEEPVYKKYLDDCFDKVLNYIDLDLKTILFPKKNDQIQAKEKLYQTQFTHPILFSVEYALAKSLMHWGVMPDAMLGHSLGEYVAACISGVLSLEDAIKLVCARGSAIERCNKGAMLSVSITEEEAFSLSSEEIHVAAINAKDSCVFSGSEEAIQALHTKLKLKKSDNISSLRLLKTSRPFHSKLLNLAIEPFQTVLKSIKRNSPKIPYLSNLTGEWIKESDVKNDNYWIEHILKTVQFSRCASQLISHSDTVFIEVGPGQTLLSLIQRHKKTKIKSIEVLPSAKACHKIKSNQSIVNALKELWCYGHSIDWKRYYENEKRSRITLPTYPFQRKRYWFDEILKKEDDDFVRTHQKLESMFYVPTWLRDPEPIKFPLLHLFQKSECKWIIFDDNSILSNKIIHYLELNNKSFAVIKIGNDFTCEKKNFYTINPKEKLHYDQMIESIVTEKTDYYSIIHFWSAETCEFQGGNDLLDSPILYKGFYSGFFLAQAFYGAKPHANVSLMMVTTGLHSVFGNENINPLKSGVLSLCRVLPLENRNIFVSNIDIDSLNDSTNLDLYAFNILNNTLKNLYDKADKISEIVAFRNSYCWKVSYHNVGEMNNLNEKFKVEKNAVYFITGGLGGMGLVIADWLSKKTTVTLLLLSRTPFPDQKEWDNWINTRGADDIISQKIQRLKQIIARGSSVIVESADIANFHQIQKIIVKTEQYYGSVKGIFHLAGVPGEGLTALKNLDDVHKVMQSKLQGTWALGSLFKHKKLDFIVCASSLTAIAGGVGQLDYCAANLFIDYFMANHPFKNCKHILTINWNSWRSVGMAVNLQHSKIHEKLYDANSLSPDQAMTVLETLLNSDYSQVIVSHITPVHEVNRIIKAFHKMVKKNKNESNHHQFIQQTNQSTYDIVKNIWKEILGFDTIHEKDTFYSLGGDSLLAIQLKMDLEKQLNIDISLQDLSHDHTLHSLSQLIEFQPVRSDRTIIPLSNSNASLIRKEKKAIYFIHPLGGTALCYFPLKSHLKTNLPCYAIQDPEISKKATRFRSIDNMALHYTNEIIENQKMEEIVLIGFSFGGNVAIEMVPFLEKKGIVVKKVILIDSWANFGNLSYSDQNLASGDHSDSLKIIQKYYGVDSPQYQAIQRRLKWLREYKPTSVNVPVVLLKAKELLPIYQKIASEDHGWKRYCLNSLVKYTIAGTHDTALKSCYLPALCQLLNTLI